MSDKSTHHCLIAFGANLSNPKRNFKRACALLKAGGVEITTRSHLWGSPAWPKGSKQPDYVNGVLAARYAGTPEALLTLLQSIEKTLGRVRSVRNAARTLDLDLLCFEEEARDTARLTLPHPRMRERAFVLLPLCELDAEWMKDLAHLPSEDIVGMRHLGAW